MRFMTSVNISVSGFVSPQTSTALRTRCTRRSVLEKVPSFSAKLRPGSTTSAYLAVSVMKRSSTTRKSSDSSARMTWWVSGSVRTGSSPKMKRPLMRPSIIAGKHSVALRPGVPLSRTPQAASNLARAVSLPTFW